MTPGLTHIDLSHPDTGITVATLNRPDRLNALTFGMFAELAELAHWADEDPDTRVLILTGAGRAFCAGLDLDDASTLPHLQAADMLRQHESWADAITAFARIGTPVIAAVNGAAAGAGFALALAADIRICSSNARFNGAFVRIGLSGGDCGTSWTLPRLVVDAPSLAAALAVENRNQVLATRTPDMLEALTAFREKRIPEFANEISPATAS